MTQPAAFRPNGTEIAFDYGALDMIVVQADPGGQCYSVTLCP